MKEIKRGEIYYANLYPVKGSEQGGIRPVLILQNDKGNEYSHTTIVTSITCKRKRNLPTHIFIKSKGLKKKSVVMLEQIRTIDKSRLIRYVGKLDNKTMNKINQAINISLGMENDFYERK